jgi:hypothetical protein
LIRRALSIAFTPLYRFLIVRMTWDDAWELIPGWFMTPQRFGSGSRHDFRWYLSGDSRVEVEDIDGICEWLSACEYASDSALFNERDFWQHPVTFEQLRRGDCEDHALWAWRKLIEIGIEAELYVGEWFNDLVRPVSNHAWVCYAVDGSRFLLEPAVKERATMVRRWDAVRHQYRPHYSVDHTFQMRTYAGRLLWERDVERDRREAKRSRSRAATG